MRTKFSFTPDHIKELEALMVKTRAGLADDAEQERRAIAYAIGLMETRVGDKIGTKDDRPVMDFAASGDPTLSNQFAGDLRQDHPCVLDSKEHLAELTSRDAQSGLAFLPIALADLRTLTMNQRNRLAQGLGKLAMDYDVVLIDGGSIEDDEAIASLVPIASQVVLVAANGALDPARARDVVEVLQVAPERMAGVLLSMSEPA